MFKLRTDGVFACPVVDGDYYTAYCHAQGYGDYDHGAVWFELEPRATEGARQAEVLFLGNSRMQFAFSTAATSSFFRQARLSYYLLGFSHFETMEFTGPLLRRLKPRAKAYVINVDRFFEDRQTAPARTVLTDKDALGRYREKRIWQLLQQSLCSRLSRLCGDTLTFVRERATGAWVLRGHGAFKASGVADGPATDRERWDQFAQLARTFVANLGVTQNCVVLTVAPSDSTKIDEARSIAAALSLPLVVPRVENLRTFDSSHLDVHSAERWSSAFFAEAGDILRGCLASSSPSRSGQ